MSGSFESNGDVVRVRPAALEAIAGHARREAPFECCGLLIGAGDEVTDAVAAANVAADPRRRYEVSPRDHLAQVHRCRELSRAGRLELSVVGAYHSHPHSRPAPSPTDLELAWEEFVYIIAGPVGGAAPLEICAFRFRNGAFESLRLVQAAPVP
jgi:proteasome lid subunit RPN8/RPN11